MGDRGMMDDEEKRAAMEKQLAEYVDFDDPTQFNREGQRITG